MEKSEEKLELITQYFDDFSALQLQQLRDLEMLYKEWNARINVISRKDEAGLYEKHILHSLSIAAAFDCTPGMDVLDLGTGGGFPGIPLAIFFPSVNFYLVDSIGKKIRVVEAVAAGIGLKNVTAAPVRAESIHNRKFDAVVSRAVAPLQELWRWSVPILKKKPAVPRSGGDDLPVAHGLICLKGGDLSEEIAASGQRPRMMEVYELFPREFFRNKYILHLPF